MEKPIISVSVICQFNLWPHTGWNLDIRYGRIQAKKIHSPKEDHYIMLKSTDYSKDARVYIYPQSNTETFYVN